MLRYISGILEKMADTAQLEQLLLPRKDTHHYQHRSRRILQPPTSKDQHNVLRSILIPSYPITTSAS